MNSYELFSEVSREKSRHGNNLIRPQKREKRLSPCRVVCVGAEYFFSVLVGNHTKKRIFKKFVNVVAVFCVVVVSTCVVVGSS